MRLKDMETKILQRKRRRQALVVRSRAENPLPYEFLSPLSLLTLPLLLILSLAIPLALAAPNDPGHDTLYIEQQGSSELNGSMNITEDLKVANRFYSTYLDILGNNSIQGSTNRIIGTDAALRIESPYDIIFNGAVGTTKTVYFGDSSGDSVVVNITGDLYVKSGKEIYVGTSKVCLANGTNCIGGNNTGNVSAVGAGSGLTDSGSATNPVLNVGAGAGITVNADNITINPTYTQRRVSGSCGAGSSIRVIAEDGTVTCEDDDTGSGADGTGGWTNTSTTTTALLAVGINTTQPNYTLDIIGQARVSGALYANGSTVCTAANGLCAGSSGSAGGWTNTSDNTSTSLRTIITSSAATGSFLVKNSTDTHLFVNGSNGRVGIGTANPSTYLQVVGISDARIIVDSYANGTSYPNTGILSRAAQGTADNPSAAISGQTLFSMSGKGYTGSAFSSSAATIKAYAAENFSATNQGAYITFETTPIGTTASGPERMRITDSGNIGIGTTTPNKTLDVNGTSQFSGNQTWQIPTSQSEVCFEKFVGTTQNYSRCINSTGQMVERFGTFPAT
jgi:hypothetical protein